jgi:hypothetical protein
VRADEAPGGAWTNVAAMVINFAAITATRESAGALIGAPLRVDSEGSIDGSLGGRGSAQKSCQPLVKCDGN